MICYPGGLLPSNRLMVMCSWMGSHFHDWIDYNRVAFSIEFLEWGMGWHIFGILFFFGGGEGGKHTLVSRDFGSQKYRTI